MNTGLDSPCFAVLVARLEDHFGVDRFSASDDISFPVTICAGLGKCCTLKRRSFDIVSKDRNRKAGFSEQLAAAIVETSRES